MKVFVLTTVMAPYRVQLFSEIGKQCQLYVCFEQMRSAERDEKWYDETSANFQLVRLEKWGASVNKVKSEVIKCVRDIRPDVVIAYEYHTNTSLLLMSYCLLKGIPYMINCDGAFISKSMKDIVKRFYISRAKGFISSGSMSDQYLLHYGADKNRIYGNHFTSLHEADIRKETVTPPEKERIRQKKGIAEKYVVLSVGQFIHRKGNDVLLKAAGMLADDVGLYIVGGKATAEYMQLVEEYKLKNVHFIDFIPPQELKEYFLAADVFVLPTREDVWGLVINEAMAAGLPVVTTDRCVAGIEMITDGVNGYLVPVEDHKALAAAMDKVLSDEALRKAMAQENLKCISKYTYETSGRDVWSAIKGVYDAACQKN